MGHLALKLSTIYFAFTDIRRLEGENTMYRAEEIILFVLFRPRMNIKRWTDKLHRASNEIFHRRVQKGKGLKYGRWDIGYR